MLLDANADLGPANGPISITWTGDRFGVAVTQVVGTQLRYLRELGVDARPTSQMLAIATSLELDSIAAADAGYVMAATTGTSSSLATLLVDHMGAVLATHDVETAGTAPSPLQIVRGATGFGAAWLDFNDAKFRPLLPDGTASGVIQVLPSLDSRGYSIVALAARADGYSLVGSRTFGDAIDYLELDATGTVVAGPTMLVTLGATSLSSPAFVTADHRQGIAFTFNNGTMLRVVQTCM